MKYTDHKRNHVIIPGREQALQDFLNQDYNGMIHKKRNAISSNSEDALTWSCFDIISQLPHNLKIVALDEILEHSYGEFDVKCNFSFTNMSYCESDVKILVGKKYSVIVDKKSEETEVDASVETPDKIIFFEAKLYSSISMADETKKKPHDQIARKLRVGQQYAHDKQKEFYFIFLDIAPPKELLSFSNEKKSKENALINSKAKWKSAWWFNYYKKRSKTQTPLKEVLKNIDYQSAESIANNMGWITWADLFKIVMRGMINKCTL